MKSLWCKEKVLETKTLLLTFFKIKKVWYTKRKKNAVWMREWNDKNETIIWKNNNGNNNKSLEVEKEVIDNMREENKIVILGAMIFQNYIFCH